MKKLTIFFLLCFYLIIESSSFSATRTSVSSGVWNAVNTAIWDCGCVPSSADNIVISANTTVTLGISRSVSSLTIQNAAVLDNDIYNLSFVSGANYVINGIHRGLGDILVGYPLSVSGTGIVELTGNLTNGGAGISQIVFLSGTDLTLYFTYIYTTVYALFIHNQSGSKVNLISGDIQLVDDPSYAGSWIENEGILNVGGNVKFGDNTSGFQNTGLLTINGNLSTIAVYSFVSLTNFSVCIVGGDLIGSSLVGFELTQYPNSTLNVGGNVFLPPDGGGLYSANIGSTVNYDGAASQQIYPDNDFLPGLGLDLRTYNHLSFSNSGVKTLDDHLSIFGNLTIQNAAQLDASINSYSMSIYGNWTNTSNDIDPFAERTGTVVMNGINSQTVSIVNSTDAETFYNLTLQKDSLDFNRWLPGIGFTPFYNVYYDGFTQDTVVHLQGNIAVSNQLNLIKGGLYLHSHTLTISSYSTTAITQTAGFIKSETPPSLGYGFVNWQIGNSVGNYQFPFSKSFAASDFIPVTFNTTQAGDASGSIAIATYSTASTNTVYPTGVNNVNRNGIDNSSNVVDRFWIINSNYLTTNPTATFTLTTTISERDNVTNPRAQRWNSSSNLWEFPLPNQTYSITATGVSVSVPNFSMISSPWTIADNNHLLSAKPLVSRSPNATICYGTSVTLTANGVNAIYYSWSPTVSLTTLSLTTVATPTLSNTLYHFGNDFGIAEVIASPTATTTYTLIISNNSGIDTSYITVTVPEEIVAIIQSANSSICSGESYAIASKTNISTPEHYAWNPTTGLDNATVFNPIASPQVTTTYTLTVFDNWSCYNSNMVTQLIHVEVNPTLTVSAPITICNGTDTTLTATVLGGSLLWSTNSTSNTIAIAPDSTTTYTAFATNSYCQPKQFITVTVIDLPTVSAGVDAFMCVGAATGVTLNGSSSDTPSWNPTSFLGNSNSSVTTANPTSIGVYHYTLTATEPHGCSNYDGVMVRVDTLLIINAGSDLTICSGIATLLNATITPGANIAWSPATGLTSNTSSTPTLTPIVIGVPTQQLLNYTITVSAPGCNDETDNLTIQVLQSPVLVTSNVSICVGIIPTLSVSGADSYLWSDGSDTSSISPLLSSSTTYTLLGTNNNGCTDTNIVQITVHNLPPVDAGSNITASTALTINLNGSGASVYLWSPAEPLSAKNIANPEIKTRITQKYNLIGTDNNGCVNEDSVYIKYIVCDEVFVPDAFSPNADGQNDELEVIVEDSQCIQALNFQIYDRWGTKVFETTNPDKQWDGKYLGKELTDAVFVYRIDIKNVDDKEITQKGNISLIR